jgi:hypothetical protein
MYNQYISILENFKYQMELVILTSSVLLSLFHNKHDGGENGLAIVITS